MASEQAELVGGPWDGGKLAVNRTAAEALIWFRGSESVDTCAGRPAGELVHITLKYPTRHRYCRTGRLTASGATVFRHAGRVMGVD